MRYLCLLVSAFSLANMVTSSAVAGPKEDCETVVKALGYSTDDYLFKEAGIFAMAQHRFGTLTCYVDHEGKFDSLYRGDVPLAEDGYFGAEALKARDKINVEADSEIEAARKKSLAEIERATLAFDKTKDKIDKARNASLEALRVKSDPFGHSFRPASAPPPAPPLSAHQSSLPPNTPDHVANAPSSSSTEKRFVNVDRLSRRTCPSTRCGNVGKLFLRESVEILERKDGWARITKYYSADCTNGVSRYVDSGDARCRPQNGIVDGKFAEWVSEKSLSAEAPPDPGENAKGFAKLVAQSDDYGKYKDVFIDAARRLIKSGQCTARDFSDGGGWVSSTNRGSGYYFAYCGGTTITNRIYLNVRTGKISR